MKALLCKELGPADQLVLEDIEPEALPAHAVRIKVAGCGVNFPDTLVIEGKYQFKPPLPFSPGAEMAGTIIECGEKVQEYSVGDRVMGVFTHGCYREEFVAPAAAVIPVPEGMSLEQAAVFPMAYGTSYHALKQRADLQPGETLLVLGAAGGVGLAAVELGKAMGARVIAAVGDESKFAVCQEHGADEVINYRAESLKQQIKALTGGQGADVIYDPVGGDAFDDAVSALAWRGRILVVGFAQGRIPELPINRLLLKGAAAVGVFWGSFAMREAALNQKNFEDLAAMYAAGQLRPAISARYTLEQVPQALGDLLARKARGKLLIQVADV